MIVPVAGVVALMLANNETGVILPVREAAGMERYHAGMDVVAAEKVAAMIEDHFVVVVVVVEERHLERARVGLERPRREYWSDVDGAPVAAVLDRWVRRNRIPDVVGFVVVVEGHLESPLIAPG